MSRFCPANVELSQGPRGGTYFINELNEKSYCDPSLPRRTVSYRGRSPIRGKSPARSRSPIRVHSPTRTPRVRGTSPYNPQ